MKKRMGLFMLHDPDGIVDKYITYLLDEIMGNLTDLIIISNGNIKKDEINKLYKYTDMVFIREDKGFDAAAFKFALIDCLGFEKLSQYDELVFFNDTFYGPFHPFKIMFDEMDKRDVDFWGITRHKESSEFKEHIQTYFYVVRKPMLCSKAFRAFWEEMKMQDNFVDLVNKYEAAFTTYFADKGYTWDVYIDASKYESENFKNNFNIYAQMDYVLLRYHNLPVVERKNFTSSPADHHFVNGNENTDLALKYIKEHTNYDINMIWDNLLRLYNLEQIRNNVNLDYILSSKKSIADDIPLGKTAVIGHISYVDTVDECLEYIEHVPENIDVYFTVKSEAVHKKIKAYIGAKPNRYIIQIPDVGRDTAALLIGCKPYLMNYEYICFVHDKKTSGGLGPASIGRSFFYNIWENTLGSKEYILNIIQTFEESPRLGFLSPPKPHHAPYFGLFYDSWTVNFENTKRLLDRLNLNCPMDEKYGTIAISNCFWCRSAALEPLFTHDFTLEDFIKEPLPVDGEINHAIERVYPFVAQSLGFYSGTVMTEDYAAVQIRNMDIYLRKITQDISNLTNLKDSTFIGMMSKIAKIDKIHSLAVFAGKHKPTYLYGCGIIGKQIAFTLNKFDIEFAGFVVSDGENMPDEIIGHKVYRLSELKAQKNHCGIIVAVGKTKRPHIRNNLNNNEFKNIFDQEII